jgi:hypothetical protein
MCATDKGTKTIKPEVISKMFNSKKLEAITANTLIVGVDIAKKVQWARFTDYRGIELGKALKFWTIKTALKRF